MLILSGCNALDPTLLMMALSRSRANQTQPAQPSTIRVEKANYSADYEQARCPFRRPLGASVTCGFLSVPEDRTQPDGPTIRLPVAIFKSTSQTSAPDPIVYLEGGPGGNPLESLWLTYNLRFAPLTQNQDLIILDQRGTGLSEPALDCPEIDALELELLNKDLSVSEEDARLLEAVRICHARLAAAGIDLTAYHSAAVAADLEDLRQLLGYQGWNLYGVSYGTRVALTALRDHGAAGGIRSVVLDSTYPLESNLYTETPANADRAFQQLFARCAASIDCQTNYPDLETVFYDLVDTFDQTPQRIDVTNPLTGDQYEMLVTGDDILAFLFQAMYATEIIPLLPQTVYDLQAGNFDTFRMLQGSFLADANFLSRGMYYSVQCHDEVPFANREEVSAANAAFPHLEGLFGDSTSGETIFTICDDWLAGEAPGLENQPVHSDIPTLIIAGELDPITPPAWGTQVAANLNHSYFIEVPGAGHGASFSGSCTRSLVIDFLVNPVAPPNETCLADQADLVFVTPNITVTLVPFQDSLFQVQGVIPDGWEEMGPGVYGQGASAILQQAVPPGFSGDLFIRLIMRSLNLEGDPESVGTMKAGGHTWTLFELEAMGSQIDLATTETSRQVFIVLMQAPARDRDRMREQIFFPALEALRPLDSED